MKCGPMDSRSSPQRDHSSAAAWWPGWTCSARYFGSTLLLVLYLFLRAPQSRFTGGVSPSPSARAIQRSHSGLRAVSACIFRFTRHDDGGDSPGGLARCLAYASDKSTRLVTDPGGNLCATCPLQQMGGIYQERTVQLFRMEAMVVLHLFS